MTYVLDTNIITAILKGNEKITTKVTKLILAGRKIIINGISYYEIKRGLLAAGADKQLEKFEKLCKEYGVLLLNSKAIFDKASELYADLRRKGKLMEDADILIASVVLCNKDFILVSEDSDFKRVKDLKVECWL